MRQAGIWHPSLQCLHLDTSLLLEHQHTKKLYGTKNNCVHVESGPMLDERYKETKKSQLPLLKSLEQKQGTVHIPCTQHHLREGAAKHPSHTLTLTPHKEQALPPPPRGASEGNPDALGAPVKPCLNLASDQFLSINEAKNPGR